MIGMVRKFLRRELPVFTSMKPLFACNGLLWVPTTTLMDAMTGLPVTYTNGAAADLRTYPLSAISDQQPALKEEIALLQQMDVDQYNRPCMYMNIWK